MTETETSIASSYQQVRVLFLIDASGSMAEGARLEAIDRFVMDMRTESAGSAQAECKRRIEIQAIRFADRAEWHVRQPTPIAVLDWPTLVLGNGTSMGAALSLAATVFDDPSAAEVLHIIVLISDGIPSDNFAKGLADFNTAARVGRVVRIAIAIDGCEIEPLKRFVGGSEPIYIVESRLEFTNALNHLLQEQVLSRAASAAEGQDSHDYDDLFSFSSHDDSSDLATCFAFEPADPGDSEDYGIETGCAACDEEPHDVHGSPASAGRLDDVQFTVYRPKTVRPREWRTLLAFVHLAERRADAPASEPDPVEQVRQQAQTLLGSHAAEYRDISADARQGIPKESEITLVPDVPGVSFNPRSRTFRWEKDVHREEFDLRADASLDGKVARGAISAYLGVILIARIDLAFTVNSAHHDADDAQPAEAIYATPYRKIFASYSRRDAEIVRQFEQFIETTGDRFLQDVRHLRAGEKWDDGLLRLIDQADVFQLFWSSNSMGSPHVRREWEYALGLGRPAFIRPTFWEDPFPESLADSLPPESLRRLHFHRLASVPAQPLASGRPAEGAIQASASPSRTSPYLRPQTQMDRPLPPPAASASPLDIHYHHKLDKPSQERLRRVSVSALVALVVAGAALAAILLWLLRQALA
jgi:uncharacterized protein YegL